MKLLHNLSRITSGRKVIKEIEGLRFIAVLLVVLSHISIYLLQYLNGNDAAIFIDSMAILFEKFGTGISIFFVISGFVLSIPFVEQHLQNKQAVSLRRYYLRRLKRLEPPYIIVLTALFTVTIFIYHQNFIEQLKHFAASLFYVHNIIYDRRSTINPVAWTLEIEVQFYVLMPLFAAIFRVKKNIVRRIILLALYFITGLLYTQYQEIFQQLHLDISLVTYLPVFITGILLADVYIVNNNWFNNGKNYLFDIAGIICLLAIIEYTDYKYWPIRLLVLGCYFFLFTAMFRGKILNGFFTASFTVTIGGMCYSIYLLHYAIIYFFMNYVTSKILFHSYHKDLLVQSLMLLTLVLFFSAVFFVFFERPFMKKRFYLSPPFGP